MKKKILIAAVIVLLLGLLVSVDYLSRDPNLILKHHTRNISLDKTEEVEFNHKGSKKKLAVTGYLFLFSNLMKMPSTPLQCLI